MIAKGRVERLRFSDSEEEGETAVEERRVIGGGGAVVRSIMRVQEEEEYGYAEATKGEIGAERKGEFIGKNEGGVQMPAMRLAKTFDFDDSEEEEEQKQTRSQECHSQQNSLHSQEQPQSAAEDFQKGTVLEPTEANPEQTEYTLPKEKSSQSSETPEPSQLLLSLPSSPFPHPHDPSPQLYTLQIHSQLLSRSYKLQLGTILLAEATRSLTLSSTVFPLLVRPTPDCPLAHAATLASNFDRSQYDLYSHSNSHTLLHAAIHSQISLNAKRAVVGYLPRGSGSVLQVKGEGDLRREYREGREGVEYICERGSERAREVLRERGVVQSRRNREWEGKEGEVRVALGKVRHNTFLLLSNLSPCQTLSLAIVHLQT